MSADRGSRAGSTSASEVDLIVLSPHLDDGILSCGGRIHRMAQAGRTPLVVTFCTADAPDQITPFAREVFRHMGLDPETGMAARREEDAESCRRVGAGWAHLDLHEAICRPSHDPDQDPQRSPQASATAGAANSPYDSPESLFGAPDPRDAETVGAWLDDALERLPPAQTWAAPLGIGGHVDHRLLRRAAERYVRSRAAAPALEFYEDYPYSRKLRNRLRVLGAAALPLFGPRLAGRRSLHSRSIPIDERDLEAKIQAISAYSSQIRPLFRSVRRLAQRVRQDARRVGGERVWSPTDPGNPPNLSGR